MPGDDWRERFLETLKSALIVEHACKAAGVSKDTAYRHRREDQEFREAWDEAREAGLDRARSKLEESIVERATNGWDEISYRNGKEISRRRVYSPPLAMWAAERLIPKRYFVKPMMLPPPNGAAEEIAAQVRDLIVEGRASVPAIHETNGANGAE